MKFIYLILITTILILLAYSSIAQTVSKNIIIDGRLINLEDVDLEKGMRFDEKITGYSSGEGFDNSPDESWQKLFRSPSCNTFLVAGEKSGYEYCSGTYTYCSFEGDTLFVMEFDEYCGDPIISHNGNFVVLNLSSMGTELLLIIGKDGEILKKFENWISFNITGNLHNTILVQVEDNDETKHNFFFVDEQSGTIRELDFSKFMTVQSHTRNEKYFILSDRDSLFVYNNVAELQWSIDKPQESSIMLYNDGKKYLYFYKDTLTNQRIVKLIEVNTQKTLKQYTDIYFADKQYFIYFGGFVDDACSGFYFYTYANGKRIFNIYNAEGVYLNAGELPDDIRDFSFKLADGKYEIIVN